MQQKFATVIFLTARLKILAVLSHFVELREAFYAQYAKLHLQRQCTS